MELSGNTLFKLRIDRLVQDISKLAEITFIGQDPEMEWRFFRQELNTMKKEHKVAYEEYMETEDDSEY